MARVHTAAQLAWLATVLITQGMCCAKQYSGLFLFSTYLWPGFSSIWVSVSNLLQIKEKVIFKQYYVRLFKLTNSIYVGN